MRLFKWMMYCLLLTTVTLVGCSKDEVDPVEAAAGEYTSTKYEVTGCTEEDENETLDVADCAGEDGCLKLTLKMDMTATVQWIFNGDVASTEEGRFALDGDKVTLDIPDSDMSNGVMDGNKITFTYTDAIDGCQEVIEYSK